MGAALTSLYAVCTVSSMAWGTMMYLMLRLLHKFSCFQSVARASTNKEHIDICSKGHAQNLTQKVDYNTRRFQLQSTSVFDVYSTFLYKAA